MVVLEKGRRMDEELSARAAGIGTLAEPVRRDLYLFVAAQPEPVGREQAAASVGIPLHTAKFHLDRLVAEGLLEVEFRRLSGRTGPGAGRPSKLYRRAARELAVSLPDRRYDLAGRILAEAVERSSTEAVPVDAAVHDAAVEHGRRCGQEARASAGSGGAADEEAKRTTDALVELGYEPRPRDTEVVLGNCPFDALVRDHTALVCGLNKGFVGGLLEGLDVDGLEACLDPEPGLCCVKVRPRS
jgi:predicted ArsR family transcriptional regulator